MFILQASGFLLFPSLKVKDNDILLSNTECIIGADTSLRDEKLWKPGTKLTAAAKNNLLCSMGTRVSVVVVSGGFGRGFRVVEL